MTTTMTRPTPIHTAHNPESGMTANVFAASRGYAVSLTDDDSGETASYVRIFPKLADATTYAGFIVGR